ncbi:peptidase S9 family protein [Aliidiomarina sedimenti]|uniref:Peptidase S9 family protein n=2 Tax=Aliidiomarina sedimenti TaxID=1933879 RepID=A0ABY0C109_9GAMM|nr:peptidase S9 family protein [Aliidiomarina sedimenti]
MLATAGLSLPATAEEKQVFSAEDIFALEYASDVQVSPDGSQIAYVRNSNDIMQDNTRRNLWIVDTATGEHYPLYADDASYTQPTWSPEGDRLAFVSNQSGRNQIHVHWLEQERSAAVSQLDAAPGSLSWSPDGRQLAFSMEVEAQATEFASSVHRPAMPDGAEWAKRPVVVERAQYQADGRGVMRSAYRHIFVLPADGGSARQLTEGNFNHGGTLAWTPQGDAIVFAGNRSENFEFESRLSHLYQVSLDGDIEQLTDEAGTKRNPVFSPDGQRLAYIQGTGEAVPYANSKLRVMNWESQQSDQLLSDFDRSVGNPHWLGNETLVVSYQDRGRTKIARVTLRSRILDILEDVSGLPSGRPYNSGMFSMNEQGDIAYTRGHATRLGDVGFKSADTEPRYLTDLNGDVLGQRTLGEVHEFTYQSQTDDSEIQAWYITPPNFDPEKSYPLVLEIHGGPHLNYGPHFSAELQRYAAEGYVVVYNNYRGSTSYGEDFAMLLNNKYASVDDFGDHMSAVDAMMEMGFIDEENLFIAGGSAGGIAATYAVGLTDRFNAAAATNPVINWVSKVLTADSYIGQIQNQFPGTPWEAHDHYWQRSPLSLVGNVTTPTMLFTGESDRRTPISDTEQYYQALQLRGVDTAMVRVPDAYHGVSARPSNMIAKVEHALAWFERYKKDHD